MHSYYVRQLDGLRFIAVLMVVLAHWVQPLLDAPVLTRIPLHFGVKLFFVLSGYLITGILLTQRSRMDQGVVSVGKVLINFFARRSLRIFPLYYLTVFITVALGLRFSSELLPWLLTYTTNVYQGIHETYLGEYTHFWSLAVEEQFYLVWPFFILFTPVRYFRYTIPAVILTSLAFRTFALYELNYFVMAYSTPSALSMLAIGGYLAWIRKYRPGFMSREAGGRMWIPLMLVVLLLHFASFEFGWYWYHHVASGTLFCIACAALIASCARDEMKGPVGRFLGSEWAVRPGKLSYGIYVVHLFVPVLWTWLMRRIGMAEHYAFLNITMYFVISYGLAVLSWKWIESPFLRLKDRFV